MKKTTLTALAVLFTIVASLAQTVTTFNLETPDEAISIDSDGFIYTSNFVGGNIFRFDVNGAMTTFLKGIAFNSQDDLYISKFSENVISRYHIDGTLDMEITIPGNPSGMLKAFDNDDTIYTRFTGNTINYFE